ncbi:PQQ-dependent sugar dehydrogenase [Thiomicrospira sp. WB1]|uniref:PQQ-dependent sugar dehydrogenase n=1 Tax=Thiomicrospira sp. WB1 TaxID=1685380 RepID=UPI000745FB1E|nr:PQQ-dependent sugar dehydrogenase [Thiomicrospira sp. WB1]KUJ71989.1 dehydrogenase [Thiomicrospira sp. WB1]
MAVVAVLACLSLPGKPLVAATLTTQTIASGLGVTWGMDFLDAERMVLTQRSGRAGVLNVTSGTVTWLEGVPEVHDRGQGGLLDVKRAPDYVQSGWLYFTYSQPKGMGAVTVLARARLAERRLVDWEDLLVTQSASSRNIHFGSRIAFDQQGHVFFTVGDRGQRDKAQDLGNHAGTVIRLNLDGSVPDDNPFAKDPQALAEIWSYGHRNPQGLYYDAEHDILWAIEHGPQGGDELNRIEKGQNYGWPEVTQGKEYVTGFDIGVDHKAGMVDPVKVYTPSIAPSDLVKQGTALWTGALALTHLNQIQLNAKQEPVEERRHFKARGERVRSLTVSTHGELYMATDAGRVYRISAAE